MRLVPILAIALAFLMGCASALAAEGQQKKQRGKPDTRPELLTMDEKVADSKTVLIGEGVRIYFTNRRYREVPYINAAGEGATRSAILVVKVLKVLHPPGADQPERALVPLSTAKDIYGERRSPYDDLVARHVGKPGIWFGEFVTHKDVVIDRDERKPEEQSITVFQANSWRAKKGPTANPLPAKQLKEVTDAISNIKAGKPPEKKKDEG